MSKSPNKTDLAPRVGASLSAMESNTKRMRGGRPSFFREGLKEWKVFTSLKTGEGATAVAEFAERSEGP